MTAIHFRVIIKSISLFLIVIAGFMLACIPVSMLYGALAVNALVKSFAITISFGLLGWFVAGPFEKENLGRRESFIIVTLTWVIIAVFGSLPYLFSGSIHTFTDAFFETMSGFTTTGASILTDIEAVPRSILFWRSLTHWIGGMGIVVFSIAFLPFFGIGGMQLFAAEVPGPTKDKIHPRITQTAKRLWLIYFTLTVAQIIFLLFGHMNLFEATCHSFATVSSGGFSTRNLSIGAFSPYVQYITVFFMIMAGVNFTMHYLVQHGRFREVFHNEELRLYLGVIAVAVAVLTFALYRLDYASLEKTFRHVLFQVVSIVTCTGFGTADYMRWPSFAWFMIFLLMFAGGCAGSTSGGIKMIRHVLLFKNAYLEFRSIIHPSAYVPLRYNQKPVSNNIRINVLAIFFLYLATFALGSLLMGAAGLDKISAMGSVASCMGGIGPGLGSTGPSLNYAEVSVAGKWILSALMLIGRLELLTVYVLFMKKFWKN